MDAALEITVFAVQGEAANQPPRNFGVSRLGSASPCYQQVGARRRCRLSDRLFPYGIASSRCSGLAEAVAEVVHGGGEVGQEGGVGGGQLLVQLRCLFGRVDRLHAVTPICQPPAYLLG